MKPNMLLKSNAMRTDLQTRLHPMRRSDSSCHRSGVMPKALRISTRPTPLWCKTLYRTSFSSVYARQRTKWCQRPLHQARRWQAVHGRRVQEARAQEQPLHEARLRSIEHQHPLPFSAGAGAGAGVGAGACVGGDERGEDESRRSRNRGSVDGNNRICAGGTSTLPSATSGTAVTLDRDGAGATISARADRGSSQG